MCMYVHIYLLAVYLYSHTVSHLHIMLLWFYVSSIDWQVIRCS